jgi:membrane-anchored protein YejM (alkaline phosphatase superfamily)
VQIDEYIDKIIGKAFHIWGDNLIVIFTSDHGDMMGNHNLWGKNHSVYEDVLRVPLIIHYPGQKERVTVKERVSSLDVFPTILDCAKVKIPSQCDGMPLKEVVAKGGRNVLISSCDQSLAIINHHMKLSIILDGISNKMYFELYDLCRDPHEFTNCYNKAEYATEQDELIRLLEKEEREKGILSRVFYLPREDKPYWFRQEDGYLYDNKQFLTWNDFVNEFA